MNDLTCPECGSEDVIKNGSGRCACRTCKKTFAVRRAMSKPARIDTLSAKRYVVTSAVSGTLVHLPFWRALQAYAKQNEAKLLVVPIRYRNPTSRWENSDQWWDERVASYLYDARAQLAAGLTLMGDISTQPTAARPLGGLQTMTGVGGGDSLIFGHPKIALESVATRPSSVAKLVLTTGAVTRPDYSDSKSGKKGEFHHVMGAVVVEVGAGGTHLRHVHGNADGAFYDLDGKYVSDGPVQDADARVLVCGDLHAARASKEVMAATFFDKDSIVAVTKPRTIVLHDVLDFESASHHNTFFDNVRLHKAGRHVLHRELTETFGLIDRIAGAAPWAEVVIVDSNHDRHFTRWLQVAQNAHDVPNAFVYHETKAAMIETIEAGREFSPMAFWAQRLLRNKARVRLLSRDESFVVDRVEHAIHGDESANGAKGSIEALRRLGTKMTVGHSHTPGISDGVYQVGTSSQMRMGYNHGASSWRWAHALQYANGKRTLLFIDPSGKWYGA